MILGKDTRVEMPFLSHPQLHAINTAYHCVCWCRSPGRVLVSIFLHGKVTFPLFIFCSLEAKQRVQPTFK